MSTITQTSMIAPPPGLLTTTVDPTTHEQGYAFPLQTAAWLNMQVAVRAALGSSLSEQDFTNKYGQFDDEGAVLGAVHTLGGIQATAQKYGDPQTLISSLATFQQADVARHRRYTATRSGWLRRRRLPLSKSSPCSRMAWT